MLSFKEYFKMKQFGGGNCKLCNAKNTTSRTCPLNPKARVVDGVRGNPEKHPNAVKILNERGTPLKIEGTPGIVLVPVKKIKKTKKEKKAKAIVKTPPASPGVITDDCFLSSGKKSSLNYSEKRNKLNEWVLPNRTQFIEWMNSIYSESHNERRLVTEREFFAHQEFVTHYIQKNSPYRGLLLYHGLGAGKTASSVAITNGLSSNKKIIVMLPASLRTNYENEIKKWGNILFKEKQFWCFVKTRKGSKLEKQLIERGIPKDYIRKVGSKSKRSQGAWLVNTKKTGINRSLDKQDKLEIQRQIDFLLKQKYTILHYNNTNTIIKQIFEQVPVVQKKLGKITKKELEDLVYESTIVSPENNPFNDKILIVDEIHNLISMMIGGGFNGPILYRLLMTAQNMKLIFLSGTPLINYPYEAAILLNILKGYSETFIIDIRENEGAITQTELIEKLRLNMQSVDRIEYIKGKLHLVRNPHGFISIWNKNQYKGVIKDTEDYLSKDRFIRKIDIELSSCNWRRTSDVIIKNNSTFPEIINESKNLPSKKDGQLNFKKGLELAITKFERYFISNSNKIKNPEMFIQRILGSVSYYKRINKTELFPTTLNPDGSLWKAEEANKQIKIGMSNWQLQQYAEVRDIERNKDRKRATQDNPRIRIKNEINEQAKKTSNLYRIMSRQRCNFVFPPNIERPRPYKELLLEENPEESQENDGSLEVKGEEEEYDYLTRLDMAINSLSYLNLLNKEDALYTEIQELLKSNDLFDSESDYDLSVLSPKFNNMVRNMNISPGLVFLYSQFRSVEGIEIFSRVLNAFGYKKYNLEASEVKPFSKYDMVNMKDSELNVQGRIIDYRYELEDAELIALSEIVKENEEYRRQLRLLSHEMALRNKKPLDVEMLMVEKYNTTIYDNKDITMTSKLEKVETILNSKRIFKVKNLMNGDIFDANENELVHSYYALWTGTEDPVLREKIRQEFNKSENKYGKLIKILMITSSGAEGISLKNVRQVHIMEPYWNRVRIEQVIGRAARIASHIELAKKQQNVTVFEYLMELSNAQKKLPISQNIMIKDLGETSDGVLYKISDIKSKVLYGFLTLMKQAAIDCRFNEIDNLASGDDFSCFEFVEGTEDVDEYNTTLDIINADKDEHKQVKTSIRKDRFISVEFSSAFRNKDGKQLPAVIKIKLDKADDVSNFTRIAEPRLIYNYYINNKIPLGFIYYGKYFFIKQRFMVQLQRGEITFLDIKRKLKDIVLSDEEIKVLTLPWVKQEISKKRAAK